MATSGKGPTVSGPGKFSEESSQPLTAEDIRFTTKGGNLYAIALGWPRSGVLRVRSLGQDSALAPGSTERVEILGATDSVPFTRERQGLAVRLPAGLAGASAIVLKLRGPGLV